MWFIYFWFAVGFLMGAVDIFVMHLAYYNPRASLKNKIFAFGLSLFILPVYMVGSFFMMKYLSISLDRYLQIIYEDFFNG